MSNLKYRDPQWWDCLADVAIECTNGGPYTTQPTVPLAAVAMLVRDAIRGDLSDSDLFNRSVPDDLIKEADETQERCARFKGFKS